MHESKGLYSNKVLYGVYNNILLILGLFSIAWLLRYLFKVKPKSGRKAVTRRAKADSQTASRYSAVSIQCSGTECQAARAVQGMRFLGMDAPNLPLNDCTSAKCNCRYSHYGDRRSGILERRVLACSMKEDLMLPTSNDQREGMGRRASDWELAYQMNPPIS